jgi:hypothetical protein
VRAPWVGRSRFEVTGWIVLTIVIGGLMVLPWLRVIDGDDGEAPAPERVVAEVDAASDTTADDEALDADDGEAGGTTTTTQLEFEWERYEVGECLDWAPDDPWQSTEHVDCTVPHRMEVIGTAPLDDLVERPTDWTALADERCTPLVEPYLGRALSFDDRLALHWIHPLDDAWDDGIRELVCGVAGREDTVDAGVLSEAAETIDPALHRPVGTCVALVDATVPDAGTVPIECVQPHHFEVAGPIAVPGTAYPDDAAWGNVTRACADVVTAATGVPVGTGAGEHAAFVQLISEPAWAAGARSTDCWVALLGADGAPVSTTDTLVARDPG